MSIIQRRTILHAGSAIVAAAAVGLSTVQPTMAKAPPIGKQASGYYRLKVGAFEVTVISDGSLSFPPSLWNASQPDVLAALTVDDRATNAIPFQLNTIVVNTGDKLVLIDTGTGGKYQDSSGVLLANLAAAGFRPEQIDTVVFTHLHPDHLWGATDKSGSKLLFPKADYVASETEIAFWSQAALPTQVPSGMRQMVEVTQQNLKTVAARTRAIKAGTEILPGIVSLGTPGHTPGHMSIHIGSNDEALLVAGDVVANATLSFRNPAWGISFDVDQALAAITRVAFLDRCVADKTMVASYHLPFPAIGHVVQDGSAYRWLPAEWSWTV